MLVTFCIISSDTCYFLLLWGFGFRTLESCWFSQRSSEPPGCFGSSLLLPTRSTVSDRPGSKHTWGSCVLRLHFLSGCWGQTANLEPEPVESEEATLWSSSSSDYRVRLSDESQPWSVINVTVSSLRICGIWKENQREESGESKSRNTGSRSRRRVKPWYKGVFWGCLD